MSVTGTTRVAAVVGQPIRHSLSPIILNAAFAAAGLDWVYVAFEVTEGRGADAVAAMRTFGLGGLSVTMPHKAAAAAAVDERTPAAEALGAVNCVFWRRGALTGDNTDGAGFLDALREDGITVDGARCALVGAGGAGRAVARALGRAGAAEVVVINRSRGPAAAAAALAGPAGRVGRPADVGSAEIVVNATPVGMEGAAEAPGAGVLPVPAELLHSGHVVVDLIYHPVTTPLLRVAEHCGARAINGLGMLVHQAAHAFRRWTGGEAPVGVMSTAALTELGRRSR